MKEHQQQVALMHWVQMQQYQFPELNLLHAIPNGGARDPRVGAMLKREGVKRGVPDLSLPVPRGGYHGMYIELKSEKGRPTPEQKYWLSVLTEQGYYAVLARGWITAAEAITDYMLERAGRPALTDHKDVKPITARKMNDGSSPKV